MPITGGCAGYDLLVRRNIDRVLMDRRPRSRWRRGLGGPPRSGGGHGTGGGHGRSGGGSGSGGLGASSSNPEFSRWEALAVYLGIPLAFVLMFVLLFLIEAVVTHGD